MSKRCLLVKNCSWPVGDRYNDSPNIDLLLDFLRISALPTHGVLFLDMSELTDLRLVRGWDLRSYQLALKELIEDGFVEDRATPGIDSDNSCSTVRQETEMVNDMKTKTNIILELLVCYL